jgi:ParB-like chromosome segregation protein Spo0J
MEYVKKKLADIKPYENNPRINDDAVDDVAESIRQCSYITPIIVDEDGVILAGHTRYKALLKLGCKECEVMVVSGLTNEQKKKYRLYDNKTGEFSKWDQKKLQKELFEVDFCGYDFGQPEIKNADADDGSDEEKHETKTCPCCGEVFTV